VIGMEKEGVVVVADVELLTMSGCCTEDGSVTMLIEAFSPPSRWPRLRVI
jgi:hypothetical protein